jgi:hypothetical protein
MEILIGIIIVGVVIALYRLWLSGSEESTTSTDSLRQSSGSVLLTNPANSWMFDQPVQATDDSSIAPPMTQSVPSDTGASQDCADFGINSSDKDCSCPVDSSSYDSAGCSVDSGNFDSGNTN